MNDNIECKEGFSIKRGGKTINFTNESKYKEIAVINCISATWDDKGQTWGPGKTYTKALTAEPGETVSAQISYSGCGKGRDYAALYAISITGMRNWLYKISKKDVDPYASDEAGNSNYVINIISDEYNNYTATFANTNSN